MSSNAIPFNSRPLGRWPTAEEIRERSAGWGDVGRCYVLANGRVVLAGTYDELVPLLVVMRERSPDDYWNIVPAAPIDAQDWIPAKKVSA